MLVYKKQWKRGLICKGDCHLSVNCSHYSTVFYYILDHTHDDVNTIIFYINNVLIFVIKKPCWFKNFNLLPGVSPTLEATGF